PQVGEGAQGVAQQRRRRGPVTDGQQGQRRVLGRQRRVVPGRQRRVVRGRGAQVPGGAGRVAAGPGQGATGVVQPGRQQRRVPAPQVGGVPVDQRGRLLDPPVDQQR